MNPCNGMNESIFFSGDHFVAGKKEAMNLTNNYFEPVVTRILNKGFTWLIQVITIHSDDVCRRVSSIRLHSEQGSHHKQQWRLACHGAVSPHMYITSFQAKILYICRCTYPSIQPSVHPDDVVVYGVCRTAVSLGWAMTNCYKCLLGP